MTAKQALLELVTKLPEDRAAEILQMAHSVLDQKEPEDWRNIGLQKFARAYGEDEPEYSEADIRPEKQ